MTMADTRPMTTHPVSPAGPGEEDGNPLTYDGPPRAGGETTDQAPPSSSGGPDRKLISLVVVAMLLTAAVVVLGLQLARTASARQTEQEEAARVQAELEQQLDQATEEAETTADTLSGVEAEKSEIETAMADLGSTLDRVREESQAVERLFPIDLTSLGAAGPDGEFEVGGSLTSCRGWTDCSEENWTSKIDELAIECARTCSLEGPAQDEPGALSFSDDDGSWQAEGPFPASCRDTPKEATWTVELVPVAVTLSDQELVVQRFEGTASYDTPSGGGCGSGRVALDIEVVRR